LQAGGAKMIIKKFREASIEMVKDLNIREFGTPEELIEKSKPLRNITDLEKVKEIFDQIAENGPLISARGIKAMIVKSTKKKIFSWKAIHTSLDEKAHLLAIANTDILFSNAIEKTSPLDPNKKNKGIVERKNLFSPMEYNNCIIPVKFTVFKYDNNDQNLYSIEAIDINIK